MRILHLLSQVELTGAETHAAAIADQQVKNGHQVFIISDTFRTKTLAQVSFLPLSKRRHIYRVLNALKLRQFIKDNKIQVVHGHSRASSSAATAALRLLDIPLVSTIHGRQHIHRSSVGKNVFGQNIIAVTGELKRHMREELQLLDEPIEVLQNPFGFESLKSQPWLPDFESPQLSLVGRASGMKGKNFADFICVVVPKLLSDFPKLKVTFFGATREMFSSAYADLMAEIASEYPGRLNFVSHEPDLASHIRSSTAVIAAGRAATEAFIQGIPVFAMGESRTLGFVNAENFQVALDQSFGDQIALQSEVRSPDWEKVELELNAHIKRTASVSLDDVNEFVSQQVRLAEKIPNVEQVCLELDDVYRRARMKKLFPHPVPILMYHKVPTQPLNSRHKIYVTTEVFEKQMQSLARRGFQTLTFTDYQQFRDGRRDIRDFPTKPIILTFDDGYVDNLENATPILKKFGFRAVMYLLGDATADHNHWDAGSGDIRSEIMSLDQKRQLIAEGWEIGAHAVTHRHLTEIPLPEASAEIVQCRAQLASDLDVHEASIISFAYPYGSYSDELKAAVKGAGYQFAVATDHGGMHLEDDPFAIFRVNVFPNDGGIKFRRKTSSWYRRYYRWKRGH